MTEVDRLRVIYEVDDAQALRAYQRMRSASDSTTAEIVNHATRVEDAFKSAVGSANAFASGIEDLRSRFVPLYAASQQYAAALNDLERAQKIGAISSAEYDAALQALNQQYLGASDASEEFARDVEALRNKFNPLYAASKQYERALDELNRAQRVGAINSKQYEAALEALQRKYLQSGMTVESNQSVLKRYGSQIQQVGYQFGDFAVQVGAGTSALQAAGQQLPQLLGGFGALGAVLGLVAAIAFPLANALFNSGEAAGTLEDRMKALSEAMDDYRAAVDDAQITTAEMVEKYGAATGAAREFLQALQDISKVEALTALDSAIAGLSDTFGNLATVSTDAIRGLQGPGAYASARQGVDDLTAGLGLTLDQIDRLQAAYAELQSAEGPEQQARAAADLAATYVDVVGSVEDMTTEQRAAYAEIVAIGEEASSLVGTIDTATGATSTWANAMAGVRAEINAIGAALSSIGGGAIANASKFVELKALQEGQSVADASRARQRAEMAAEFDAREAAASNVVESLLIKGERALAERGIELDAELDAARAEARANAKAAATTSSGGGGRKSSGRSRSGVGGSARSGRAESPFFGEIEKDLLNLERQISLVGKSNEEVATAKARWELLDEAKRRGIPVNAELNAQIDAQAAQVGRLTAELEAAEKTQQQFNDGVDSIVGGLIDAGLAGESLRESIGQSFRQIASDIIASNIKGAIADQFSGIGGNPLAFLGNLFGGNTVVGNDALSGSLRGISGFRAGGGSVSAGRAYVVGENEPEVFVPNVSGTILNGAQVQRAMGQTGGGSVALTIDLRGTTGDRELDAKIQRAGQQVLSKVPGMMADIQKRRQ